MLRIPRFWQKKGAILGTHGNRASETALYEPRGGSYFGNSGSVVSKWRKYSSLHVGLMRSSSSASAAPKE